jgi:hypothetical protein
MSIKFTFKAKGFTALLASEQSSSFDNRCAQFKYTIGVFANLFSMIFLQVACQRVALCKRFVTKLATEWFFTSMNSHMLIKIVAPCKRFVTQSATVWFFTCMSCHMSVKLTFVAKHFIALLTAEQLILFVKR